MACLDGVKHPIDVEEQHSRQARNVGRGNRLLSHSFGMKRSGSRGSKRSLWTRRPMKCLQNLCPVAASGGAAWPPQAKQVGKSSAFSPAGRCLRC
mmetsp:Transcript_32065/g.76545  ORF Transcript_32065/g.76545 Transcript_32065/m.76545 type:complete len:95 (-) Transcript_32065:62-346(-)